jgi:hypothetical protein
MSIAHDPKDDIDAMIRDSVARNTEFTTCPVCLGGVDPTSLHKEPYQAQLPGSPAVTGMIRRVLHFQAPDGTWETHSILDYV